MVNDHVAAIKTTATIVLLAGIWFFISPWVYGAYSMPEAWNNWIAGALMVILAAVRIGNPLTARGASVVNLLLGAWTFASPWIYGYTSYTGRFINSLCVGLIVFVLGLAASSMSHTHMTTPRTPTTPPLLHT